jgi:MSHA biogenesis protein MshO
MTRRFLHPRASAGFTLVEAIMTIAIIGIIGGIVAVFIRAPILGYRDTVDRAELTDQADLALRRMARDIRLALPNSVRVSDDHGQLELLQTRSGARYMSDDDGVAPALTLSFDDPCSRDLTALVPPASFKDARAGDYVVVYNLGEGFEPANAYALPATGAQCADGKPKAAAGGGNIAAIVSVTPSTETINGQIVPVSRIKLAMNSFAMQDTPLQSPQQRFQVVSGPVSFYCEQGPDGRLALWRAWNYPINLKLSRPPATATRALVASGLPNCDIFNYGTAASQRTGLVRIALELRGRTEAPATIRLVHQVHVDNTP